MFSAKSSKRTMTASVISLVLCFVMLLGTTFAWFTTNASTSVNTIKSGSLSVDLVNAEEESLVGKTVAFKNAESALWEPGCTYELEEVYVKNTGALALKYKIEVVGVDGDAKLLDAIDWTISVDNNNNVLEAGAKSAAIAIKGTMKKDAGNQYQDLEADGIAITVTATQAAVESDSIDDQYDKDADFAAVAAVVTELSGEDKPADLAVAYKFKPAEDASESAYKDYKADFVVSFDKDIAANAVKLAGQYGDYDWTAISNPVALAAGEEIRLLDTMLGTSVTYEEICSFGEFNCGAASNGASGVNMTVELRLYDANGDYLIAGTYTYTF